MERGEIETGKQERAFYGSCLMGKGQNVPIPIAQSFDAALESQIHRHLLSQWQRAIEKCRPAFGDFLNADDGGENFEFRNPRKHWRARKN